MKYKILNKCENFIDIEYTNSENKEIGFIEIYKNGTMYTNIEFNGNIKLIRKMLKIANKERIKNNIKNLFRR